MLTQKEMLEEAILNWLSDEQIFEHPTDEQAIEYDCNQLRLHECFLYTVENIYVKPEENNKKLYMFSKMYCSSVLGGSIAIANQVFEEFKDICWFTIFETVLGLRNVIFAEITNCYSGDNRPDRVYKKTLSQESNNEK